MKEVVLFQHGRMLGCYKLQTARPHAKFILVKFEGIDSIEETAPLLNAEVGIHEADIPPLEEGEFYIEDLVGMKVVDSSGNEVGVIKDVYSTAGNDVYEVVKEPSQEELLVPGVRDYVLNIDFEQRIMTIKIPTYT